MLLRIALSSAGSGACVDISFMRLTYSSRLAFSVKIKSKSGSDVSGTSSCRCLGSGCLLSVVSDLSLLVGRTGAGGGGTSV